MTEQRLSADDLARITSVAMDFAREGGTAELGEFIDHGFPVDATDPAGNSLVMLAAYHGQLETVQLLVARGADVDLRNERDQSPVAGAIFKGEQHVVRALVAAGADLDAGTPSARESAALFGRPELLDGAG